MRIYISHSRSFDYNEELYKPLMASEIAKTHELILPYVNGGGQSSDTKTVLQSVQVVVAEVTWAHTGQGIELGWADMLGKPILCFYRQGHTPSSSIAMITHHLYPYNDPLDFIKKLSDMLQVKPLSTTTMPESVQVMKGIN